ncbi:MAG TPA: hypothetical protein VEL47_04575 [Myxococcota bacterium]|nr:hypothetical protein [Myxococcota bacterium]
MEQVAAAKIETRPVPSWWKPKAFISRAIFPERFDWVLGKNARYPVQLVAIAKNPSTARRAVKRRIKEYLADPISNRVYYTWDDDALLPLLTEDRLKRILSGLDPMTPTLENQQFWALNLDGDAQNLKDANDDDVWRLLLTYNLPLIKEFSMPHQYEGINALGANHALRPELLDIAKKLEPICGWRIRAVKGETHPDRYFAMLKDRIFPVATKLRPLHALLCGYEPDYWHEVVGHLAILTDPAMADFYQWCGSIAERTKHTASEKLTAVQRIFLFLLEYGIIKAPSGKLLAFGGALTSSFMALARLRRGYIRTTCFNTKQVLRFASDGEFPARRSQGQIELFHVDSIEHAKEIVNRFLGR